MVIERLDPITFLRKSSASVPHTPNRTPAQQRVRQPTQRPGPQNKKKINTGGNSSPSQKPPRIESAPGRDRATRRDAAGFEGSAPPSASSIAREEKRKGRRRAAREQEEERERGRRVPRRVVDPLLGGGNATSSGSLTRGAMPWCGPRKGGKG
jgi:hypothetical protein